MSEKRRLSKKMSIEATLLKYGYIKIQDTGGYEVYVDTLSSGYDIMYKMLNLETEVFYVCRGTTKKLFPIFDIESAILMSRRIK